MDSNEGIKWVAVAIGGGVGTVCRYGASIWAANRFGTSMPYGTLFVNITGCFIIGLFMTLATERVIVSPYWRLAVSVGFLGGLTTFSSLSYETWRLLLDGETMRAIGNVALNLVIGLFATWLGIALARTI